VRAQLIRRRADRRAGLLVGAALLLLPAPQVAAQCLPGINCKFSVSGKKGRYLEKQVTPEAIAKADLSTAGVVSSGRSLDSISLNKGANSGTGIRMPATERQLLAMLDKIRAAWIYRMPPPIAVRIVGNTSYNAAAHPDNVIVVPLGLLMHATNDDEIAWVLAHEFAHIALAHFSREAKQRRLKASIETAVDCTRMAMSVAEMRARQSGNQLQLYQVQDPGMRAASAQVWAKSEMIGDVLEALNQHLSRKQEDQADAAGVDLAIKIGYSEGYAPALDFVRQVEIQQGTLFKQFGNEFGSYSKRAAAQAAGQMLNGKDISTSANDLMKGLLNNAGKLVFNKFMDALLADHRPAAKRKEGLGKYMDAAYKDLVTPESVRTWLDGVRGTDEFMEAQVAVNANDAARLAIGNVPAGDPADPIFRDKILAAASDGLHKIEPALKTRFANTPLIANTMAKLNEALGNDAAADRHYDIADRGGIDPAPSPRYGPVVKALAPTRRRSTRGRTAPMAVPAAPPAAQPVVAQPLDAYLQQSLDGFSDHVKLLVRTRNYTKALDTIDRAKKQFGDDDKFLPELITIYVQLKKTNELVDAVKRCSQLEDTVLQARCDWAFVEPGLRDKVEAMSPEDQSKLEEALATTRGETRKGANCNIAPPPPPAKDDDSDES